MGRWCGGVRRPWRVIVAGIALVLATGFVAGAPAASASAAEAHVTYGWGLNGFGQLGTGSADDGAQLTAVAIAALGTDVTQVVSGSSYSLALHADGTVSSWGSNFFGELGDGTTANHFSPQRIPGMSNIVQISAGLDHALALRADGTVWAWGDNDFGEVGLPGNGSQLVPHQVPGIVGVRQVAAGISFSLALRSNGEVWAWGDNTFGELGDGTFVSRATPKRANTVYGITQIAAGGSHGMALRSPALGGSVWTWGDNFFGVLGNGSTVQWSANPVLVDRRVTNIAAISAGRTHDMALGSDGTIWTWGSNLYGELGIGQASSASFPTPFHLALTGVTQIDAGDYQSLARRSEGRLWAWGFAGDGLLADGNAYGTVVTSPTQINALSGVVLASNHYGTAFALS
jgi:alpha-tubulin suppressor-like RCC1 family protein